MARPGRPERNRAARSFRQLRRFHHVINSNKVFGTHRVWHSELHLLCFFRTIQQVREPCKHDLPCEFAPTRLLSISSCLIRSSVANPPPCPFGSVLLL